MARILLVSIQEQIAENILALLSGKEGHHIETCDEKMFLDDSIERIAADLLIFSCKSESLSISSFCMNFRRAGGRAPVLVLLDSVTVDERIKLLDAGVDDYLYLPFEKNELAASIGALLRRPKSVYSQVISAGNISLDTLSGKVSSNGKTVDLTPMEFCLLEFLMLNSDQVFSCDELWMRVWKSNSASCTDTVRTHIKLLRKKLNSNGAKQIIKTVHGRGYMLERAESGGEPDKTAAL